jgi:hypothetical protein
MARLVRVETDYRYYTVELTEEQLKRAQESDEGYDEVMEEVMDDMEMTRLKDGGTDYFIEE